MAKAQRFTPTGLVGKWKFGHGTGTNRRGVIVDETIQANHGTVYGSPAIDFDGAGDKAAVATPWDALSGLRYAILAMRVYVGAQGDLRVLYEEKWNNNANTRTYARLAADDKLQVYARTGGSGDTARSVTSTSGLAESAWHSLLILIDAEGDAITVWDNGAAVAMGAISGAFSQNTFAADVPASQTFGIKTDGIADPLLGRMHWIGYGGSATAVTITDAQEFHDNPQAWLSGSGLDAWWPCKEGAGGTVDNAEGTAGHDLTLTNATWDVTTNGGNAYAQSGGAGDSFYAGKRWFDGTDDYVSIAHAAELQFDQADFQIHIWCAIDSGEGLDTSILAKGIGSDPDTWNIVAAETGTNKPAFIGDSDNMVLQSGGADIRDDALHLISVARDGANSQMWVDGVSVATDVGASDRLFNDGTAAITIGRDSGGNYTAMDVYQVLIGKTPKTLAEAGLDAVALFSQGAYR